MLNCFVMWYEGRVPEHPRPLEIRETGYAPYCKLEVVRAIGLCFLNTAGNGGLARAKGV